jgi:16S rRNA (guanine527-N7)-methyltransferase
VSLTAIRDEDGIQRRHFLESIALIPALENQGFTLRERTVIDVGSGSGVPGIPLKIAEPSIRLTIVEAKQRKVEFLRSVLPELGMSDVEVVNRRAEESARDPRLREQFDVAVAKALAHLRTLLELTLPFVRMGGVVLAPKGKEAESETKDSAVALETLNGSLRGIEPIPLTSNPVQHVVVVDKVLPTPERFPRRPGVPAKRPL